MAETTIHTAAREMPAYVATPTAPGSWPGVVVIHDAFGMTPVMRKHADWLAGEGFLAAAPTLFRSGGMISCMRAAFRDIVAGHGPTFDDIEATRAWLTAQPGCSRKIGVIGFCMGGGFALVLAPGRGFSASSANYGRLPKDAEKVLEGACPIVGSYGATDRSLRGAAGQLEKILSDKGIPHDIKEYPGAGHSFLDDHAPGDVPRLMLVLMKMFGAGYNEPAAVDARKRIVAFFGTHLRVA